MPEIKRFEITTRNYSHVMYIDSVDYHAARYESAQALGVDSSTLVATEVCK